METKNVKKIETYTCAFLQVKGVGGVICFAFIGEEEQLISYQKFLDSMRDQGYVPFTADQADRIMAHLRDWLREDDEVVFVFQKDDSTPLKESVFYCVDKRREVRMPVDVNRPLNFDNKTFFVMQSV